MHLRVRLILVLGVFSAAFSFGKPSQKEVLGSAKKVQIVISKELRLKTDRIRIRNLTSGREVIVTIDKNEAEMDNSWKEALFPSGDEKFSPDFSALDIKKRRQLPADVEKSQTNTTGVHRSTVFDQPIWKPVTYVMKTEGKTIKLYVGGMPVHAMPVKIVSLSPEEASSRRKLQEDREIRRNFEIGWDGLRQGRFDLAKDAFQKILSKKEFLDEQQISQAGMGISVALFQLTGCKDVMPYLTMADHDMKNRDDVSYYRGICLVQTAKYVDAEKLFLDLNQKQHPMYGESARFYLGLCAENQKNYDGAKSYYMDTVDFSSDPKLVEAAKERLKYVDYLQQQDKFENNWTTLAFTMGSGYDTNVVSSPGTAAELNLSGKSSLSFTGLGYIEFRLPWSKKFNHNLNYSMQAVHYAKGDIAQNYDVQTHSIGTAFSFAGSDRDNWSLSGGYSSTFSGLFLKSGEILQSYSGTVGWNRVYGTAAAPTNRLDSTLSISKSHGVKTPATEAANLDGFAYLLTTYYINLKKSPHLFGPGFKIGYSPTTGSDNFNYSGAVMYKWDFPLVEKQEIFFSQEASITYTNYSKSSAARKDMIYSYTGTFSKSWASWFETRFQVVGTMARSSVTSQYQYSKTQFNLLMNAFF